MTGDHQKISKGRRRCLIIFDLLKKARAGEQQGAAVITALLLTLLLLVFAGSLAQLAAVDKRAASNQVAMTQALYLAEAGVELMVGRLSQDFAAGPPPTPIMLGSGQISKITVSPVDDSTKEILSEGQAGARKARKTLKVRVQRTAAAVLENAVCSGTSFVPGGSVSITGNLLAVGDLGGQQGLNVKQAGLVVAGGNLTNKNGSIEMLPGGRLLAGGNLDNRHGRISGAGYLQADGTIVNNPGIVTFSPGGAFYTPSMQYPAGTFIIQDGGQVPRLHGPRENIPALTNPAAGLNPAGKVDACRNYPLLNVTEKGNRYEFNLSGKTSGNFFLNASGKNLHIEGAYSGKWIIAVKGNVEIRGNILPVNAGQDALVLLVDGTVEIQGNENISAVIYAGRFGAGGNSTIKGAVAAQYLDVSGNTKIIQDGDVIQNTASTPALPAGLFGVRIVSWREYHNVF